MSVIDSRLNRNYEFTVIQSEAKDLSLVKAHRDSSLRAFCASTFREELEVLLRKCALRSE
jgi:hypothetical protein